MTKYTTTLEKAQEAAQRAETLIDQATGREYQAALDEAFQAQLDLEIAEMEAEYAA